MRFTLAPVLALCGVDFQTEDFDRAGNTGELFKTDLTQQTIDLGLQFHL